MVFWVHGACRRIRCPLNVERSGIQMLSVPTWQLPRSQLTIHRLLASCETKSAKEFMSHNRSVDLPCHWSIASMFCFVTFASKSYLMVIWRAVLSSLSWLVCQQQQELMMLKAVALCIPPIFEGVYFHTDFEHFKRWGWRLFFQYVGIYFLVLVNFLILALLSDSQY